MAERKGRSKKSKSKIIKKKRLGILVGGGPAPGINGVISAATIEAINRLGRKGEPIKTALEQAMTDWMNRLKTR